jgi:hypothetical protein
VLCKRRGDADQDGVAGQKALEICRDDKMPLVGRVRDSARQDLAQKTHTTTERVNL